MPASAGRAGKYSGPRLPYITRPTGPAFPAELGSLVGPQNTCQATGCIAALLLRALPISVVTPALPSHLISDDIFPCPIAVFETPVPASQKAPITPSWPSLAPVSSVPSSPPCPPGLLEHAPVPGLARNGGSSDDGPTPTRPVRVLPRSRVISLGQFFPFK